MPRLSTIDMPFVLLYIYSFLAFFLFLIKNKKKAGKCFLARRSTPWPFRSGVLPLSGGRRDNAKANRFDGQRGRILADAYG